MGKINSYQQKKLASSLVGSPSIDTSGQIIGGAVSGLGAALVKRQEVLDVAATTKSGYEYLAAANIGGMALRKEYQTDPTLDPLTFDAAYQEQAGILATKFRENMPERLHNKFDVLISKANASQTVANTKWAFAQQNKNALEGFYELGQTAIIMAGDAMNAEDYMIAKDLYTASAQEFKPTMTIGAFNRTNATISKNQAKMFWANSVDFRNGGKPNELADALEDNPEFRKNLQASLGASEFKRLEGGLSKLTKLMGQDAAFRDNIANNEQLRDKMSKIYDPDSSYGLKEVTNDLEAAINRKNHMGDTNNRGQHDEAIEQAKENIDNLQKLKRSAAVVNDATTISNPEVMADLRASIKLGMDPYQRGTLKKKIEAAQKNITKQAERQDLKYNWYEYLLPWRGGLLPFKHVRELITRVPKEVRAEKKENIRAPQSTSEYMKTAQALNGRILNQLDKGEITYSDSLKLIKQIGLLDSVKQYDSVTSEDNNWYTEGYDAFDGYVRGMALNTGTPDGNRKYRDEIRGQMLDELSVRIAQFGDEYIAPGKIAGIIGQIKRSKSTQIYREVLGAEVGDYVNRNGRATKWLGWEVNTGQPLWDTKDLQKAVDR